MFSCNLPSPFCQNNEGLLGATKVTQRWNSYQNKREKKRFTWQKKMFPLLLLKLQPSDVLPLSNVQCSTTEQRTMLYHWATYNALPLSYICTIILCACSFFYFRSVLYHLVHSSGAVWESRWPSWAVHPNEPSGFRGRKAILNHASALVSACP